MAILATPESSSGIKGAIMGALGLFGDTNKALGTSETMKPTPIDPYESSMSEDDVKALVREWKKIYAPYYDPIDKSQILNFQYWLGNQRADDNTILKETSARRVVDNLVWEAVETFLPMATRANPDPVVTADPSDEGQALAHDIKNVLVHEADTQKLRRKLARMLRHWIINRVGAVKISWDVKTKSIKTEPTHPRRFIFDKDGYIDEGGHFMGAYLGEKKKDIALDMIRMFPSKSEIIKKKVDNKMGTKVEYYEWWYRDTEIFFTLADDDEVLGKFKNHNWNYDGETDGEDIDPETGGKVKTIVQGLNHLKEPRNPYIFLSIFSTGIGPHDDTSPIQQGIPMQDMANRRWRQIDMNVEGMNNGMAVSGKSFTEEQAAQAASARRRGVAFRVPDGNVNESVVMLPNPPLPRDIFTSLQDARSELRNMFGTAGSTPQGVENQDTVRGKILVGQLDTSRIGGAVTEQIEQVVDSIYNMWVQMMFVFYDEEHYISAAGAVGGAELIMMKNSRFQGLKTLVVTVKEGSLIPRDPMTQRNEAVDLWSANAIDPLSFYKKLDFADPVQATNQLILWQMLQKGQIMPQQYLPSFQLAQATQPMGQPGQPGLPGAQPGTGGPAVSPPGNAGVMNQSPMQQSPEAVQAQSKELLQQIPLPR